MPEEEDLVPQKCLEEYKKLQHQIEPIRVQKTLNVLQANMSFNSEAAHLQVCDLLFHEKKKKKKKKKNLE